MLLAWPGRLFRWSVGAARRGDEAVNSVLRGLVILFQRVIGRELYVTNSICEVAFVHVVTYLELIIVTISLVN